MAKTRKDHWNTYATYGYTHDVANDPASTGGVHLHQVRFGKAGWMTRIMQSNGNHRAAGRARSISDTEGEAFFATAQADA